MKKYKYQIKRVDDKYYPQYRKAGFFELLEGWINVCVIFEVPGNLPEFYDTSGGGVKSKDIAILCIEQHKKELEEKYDIEIIPYLSTEEEKRRGEGVLGL